MASLLSDKPYVPTWRPPVKVNPLIRLCRWTALIGGIVYGYNRREWLSEVAKCQREDYMARQAIVDAEAAEKKRLMNEQEMCQLAIDAGIATKEASLPDAVASGSRRRNS